MYSFVPSIGSTSQKRLLFFSCFCDSLNSSETIIILGKIFCRPKTAILLTAMSPFVTGDASIL